PAGVDALPGSRARMSTQVPDDVPAQFQTFLAFDFGLRRTGVAVGNRMLRTATPQPTIRAEGSDARLAQAQGRGRPPPAAGGDPRKSGPRAKARAPAAGPRRKAGVRGGRALQHPRG